MRVSFLGHASLLAEGEWGALLFDPLLGSTLGHGANEIYPSRHIDPARLPPIDRLIISHRHNDHFDAESLRTLRGLGNPSVLLPDDPALESGLRALGYTETRRLKPFEIVQTGGLTIVATPSSIDVPELGFVLIDDDGVVWNQVDSHFAPFVDDVLRCVQRQIDAVLIPYQSGTFNEYIPLLGDLMPGATVAALRSVAAAWRNTLVEAAIKIRPKVVIPFANGLCYPADVESMNSLHFLDDDGVLIEAVRERLPDVLGHLSYPGLRLELRGGVPRIEEHAASCLDGVSRPGDRLRFQPLAQLDSSIRPLLGGPVAASESRLDALTGEIDECIRGFVEQANRPFFEQGNRIAAASGAAAWHLIVDGLDRPRQYVLSWTPPGARLDRMPPGAKVSAPGMRIHVNDLVGILENRVDLYDVVLGARVRLSLPDGATVSNDNVTDLCVNPAWFALANVNRAGVLLERMGLEAPRPAS